MDKGVPMKRFIAKLILFKSICNKCVGEDIVTFYNRYSKWKIIQDWLFRIDEYGILNKKRWKLVKPLSKLLPNKL